MPAATITAPDDARVADYRGLNDQPFRRSYEGDRLFIAEGFVAIDRLLESGHQVRSVLLAPSRFERFAHHLDRFEAAGTPVYVADRAVIAAIVGFDLHRGVVACAHRRPAPMLDDVTSSAERLAVLEGLNDAENLGAIARAARALGIDALVTDPSCTDAYSRRSVRVSMGEILMLPVVRLDHDQWPGMLGRLHDGGFETWAMTPATIADNIWELDVPERLAVLIGAEGAGLTPRTLTDATRRVRIPLRPGVDSLNVGHAAAVTFAAIGRAASTIRPDVRSSGPASPTP